MRNLMKLSLTATIIAAAGCGGGGSGGKAAEAPPPPVGMITVTCPSGTSTKVADTAEAIAAAKAACTLVTGTPSPLEGSTTASPVELAAGIEVPFNGKLASATAVLWQGEVGNGTQVPGTVSLSTDGMKVNFVPTVRQAYGEPFKLPATGIDSVGRSVTTTLSFATAARSCDGFSSKPAAFSPELQTCVAPIGGQAIVDSVYNRATDNSCALTAGQPLSAACKAYLANGTIVVTQTLTTVADGHQAFWLAYLGTDGRGNLALLDAVTGSVVGTTTLSSVVWITGNHLGASVSDGVKVHGASWDGSKVLVD